MSSGLLNMPATQTMSKFMLLNRSIMVRACFGKGSLCLFASHRLASPRNQW